MKRAIVVAAGALGMLSSTAALADYTTQGSFLINQIGINNVAGAPNQNRAYISVAATLQVTCPFNTINFDLSTATGRAMYSELLIAKIAGKPLTRIDYIQPAGANTNCLLTFVEIN
ncbi:MAG: hypothetical protein ABI624_11350 [Casimicrobiaceae bacterium]